MIRTKCQKKSLQQKQSKNVPSNEVTELYKTLNFLVPTRRASYIWPNTIALRLCLKLKHQRWLKEPPGATVGFQQKMLMKRVEKWSIFRIILRVAS